MSLYNTTNTTNFAVDMADFGMTLTAFRNIQAYVPPALSMPSTTNNIAGFGDFHNPEIPSTKFEVGSFELKILMDENMESYNELYKWMYSLVPYGGKMIDSSIHGDLLENISPEALYVHFLDNTHRTIVSTHAFTRPWIKNVTIPEFNVTTNITYPMVMEVEFGFMMFKVYNSFNQLVKNRKKIYELDTMDVNKDNGPNAMTGNLVIGNQKTIEEMIADRGK